MRFSIHGRYDLDVERVEGRWVVYRRGLGTRREDPTIFVPADLHEENLAAYLEDLLHEEGRRGGQVRRIR